MTSVSATASVERIGTVARWSGGTRAARTIHAVQRKARPLVSPSAEQLDATKTDIGDSASTASTVLKAGAVRIAVQTSASQTSKFASGAAYRWSSTERVRSRAMPMPSACGT